jgi:hypothetical protein
MVGMGALVTKSVPDFHLVFGQPARSIGYVCRCGKVLALHDDLSPNQNHELLCAACGLEYIVQNGSILEQTPPT